MDFFPDNIPCPTLRDITFNIKGNLHYKTITSQTVSSEAQVKNFLILRKSYVLFLRYSSFCIFNHPMIYQICHDEY